MKKYIIRGRNNLKGEVAISGAKNVALKAIVAACLTNEEVILHNIPKISDVYYMTEMVKGFGGKVENFDHTLKIKVENINNIKLPLETAVKMRASSLFFAPFIIRNKKAQIPNPGGDKIGARRIDMHIKGLERLGVDISYNEGDGYFYAKAGKLRGANYRFAKNTHTGTEQMILAGVLAEGTTILENTALEPEIDELIKLLNLMGAKITREGNKTIKIEGVKRLSGATYSIKPDRNEAVTFAVASALLGGEIWLKNIDLKVLGAFLDKFKEAGGEWEEREGKIRFYIKDKIRSTRVLTEPHPGFMTDWQGPWCVLMTQAEGESVIHEAIYEDRFQYTLELKKMGADISPFNPEVKSPYEFYNFNYKDRTDETMHAIRIRGKKNLKGADVKMGDLRAGATLVLAALIAKGKSVISGIEQIERGYEEFDVRLKELGVDIKYTK